MPKEPLHGRAQSAGAPGLNCPACGHLGITISLRLDRAQLSLCKNCGHAVTIASPRRVTEMEYGQDLTDRRTFEAKYLRAREFSYERGLDALGPANHRSLLDFGANYGHFVAIARRRGWHPVGYEPGPDVRRLAVAEPIVGTLDAAAKYGRFDVITLWDVLEHLPDPREELKMLRTLLTPNGRLIIRVPDARIFHARKGAIGTLLNPLYLKLCHPTNPEEHFHHFTPRSLELTGRAAGFVPGQIIEAAPDERIAAGRTILDGAVRKVLHRVSQRLPYEFTLILSRPE